MFLTRLRAALVIFLPAIVFVLPLVAQQAESTSQPVVVTAPEMAQQNATVIDPSDLGLTGDMRKIDSVGSNVSIDEAGADSFTDVYAVRGLANTPNFSKQALTLYVDDVPSASTFTNFAELGQLQSVEIIRGPRGDLVGKNAEAGLLDIHTIVPDNTPRLIASTARASYEYWTGNALVSGPVVPNILFAKIEGGYLSRDGFLGNTFLNTRPDFQQHAFGRVQLRLTTTTEWEINFSAEYHFVRDGVQRFVPLTSRDPFRVAFDFDGRTDIDGNVEALRIARTFESAILTTITSWREWQLDPYTADFDYSPAPVVRGRFDLAQTQLAEEIRVDSLESEHEWRWRIGTYVDRVTNGGDEIFAIGPLSKVILFHQREAEFAAFGQVTRHFDNNFEVTAGMRLDYDVDQITRRRTVSFAPSTTIGSDRSEWNSQPKLTVAFEWTPQMRAYVSSAYGYRNGGYSFLETNPRFASFNAEHVWANEVGTRVDCFDSRLELRSAAFMNRIENYQVERPSIPPDITVFNAPLVLSYGAEAELVARPFTGVEVKGAFGYTRSEFSEFSDPFTGADYSGNRTPFSPDFTAALQTRYTVRDIFAELDLLASGETFYDEANTASIRQAPHAQLNARVGYQDRHLLFYLYAENLNDARYFTQKIAYAGVGAPAPPRTFGVVLSIKL
jgi:iron complex outermembrane receptor protein